MHLHKAIDEAAEKIRGLEEKREKVASALKPLRKKKLASDSKNLRETDFIRKIKPLELKERVAGVDSGFVGKSFSAIDLVLIRAMAAVFDYQDSKLVKAQFHPCYFKFPEPFILADALERDEFNCAKSLYRLQEEIKTGKEVIEKFKPKYLFLDGSIIPQHADKPRNASKVTELYHQVLNEFQALYAVAEENDCSIIATVEDSRGTRFKSIVQEELTQNQGLKERMENFFDSSILDLLLKKGERSFAFPYASKAEKHPILNDLKKEWAEKIHVFYLKPSDYDRPLRVEFLDNGEKLTEHADQIASLTFALSCQHKEYAYPAVLIEADLRARLKPEEINIVFDKMMDKAGKNAFMPQRRDKRPFR